MKKNFTSTPSMSKRNKQSDNIAEPKQATINYLQQLARIYPNLHPIKEEKCPS